MVTGEFAMEAKVMKCLVIRKVLHETKYITFAPAV